jgi:dipeptidyl aminopeptidase/acylaminoacyl peptidase
VARFNLDPTRIGAFGGSAGGNLAALLATSGEGATDAGSRVAAVVDMSGPIDLTGIAVTDDFVPVQLAYLGCTSEATCPNARAASPVYFVDPTDPPFFVAHSTEEFIPIAQADKLVTALRENGVDTTYVTVDGTLHSLAMFDDDMRERVLGFFKAKLAPPLFDLGAEPAD